MYRFVFNLLIGLSVMPLSLESQAQFLYRYADENGVSVISNRVPPEQVVNGYEVLNMKGQVMRVVPPALTEEEKKEYLRKRAEEKLLKELRVQQLEEDKQLLRVYPSAREAERARTRQYEEIESKIGFNQSEIIGQKRKLSDVIDRASDIEKNGGRVPDSLKQKHAEIVAKITMIEEEITRLEQEKIYTADKYDGVVNRLKIIDDQGPGTVINLKVTKAPI